MFKIDRLSNLHTAMAHEYAKKTNKCQNYNYAFVCIELSILYFALDGAMEHRMNNIHYQHSRTQSRCIMELSGISIIGIGIELPQP